MKLLHKLKIKYLKKERLFMNAKLNYTDESIEAKVIRDFLPPPFVRDKK